MRILVVEDEDSIASFVVKGLTAEGHSVERAATASEAIGLGVTYDFDLILLDLILPDGNGIDVLKRWRPPSAGAARWAAASRRARTWTATAPRAARQGRR